MGQIDLCRSSMRTLGVMTFVVATFLAAPAQAETNEELARELSNPVAALISQPAATHLDTVFTFADRDCVLLAPVVLSRAVDDTATPTSALIPWNSCGAYMAATLGVATWSYAPYAVFSYVSPLLTIALAYAGFRMPRAP
jgi:Na+/H+ antiporter NhaC